MTLTLTPQVPAIVSESSPASRTLYITPPHGLLQLGRRRMVLNYLRHALLVRPRRSMTVTLTLRSWRPQPIALAPSVFDLGIMVAVMPARRLVSLRSLPKAAAMLHLAAANITESPAASAGSAAGGSRRRRHRADADQRAAHRGGAKGPGRTHRRGRRLLGGMPPVVAPADCSGATGDLLASSAAASTVREHRRRRTRSSAAQMSSGFVTAPSQLC